MRNDMRDDLGMAEGEVHAAARKVLDFWFGELTPEQHFAKDDALDRTIARRFAGLRGALLSSGAVKWRDTPETLLAAIIVLDQFSRNIYRGQAAAFAGDALALTLTQQAIAAGWDSRLPPDRRQFLYMPLMHSEDAAVQEESIRRFAALGDDEVLAFAREHHDVIERFGRFPSRNEALGRETSAEERDYLNQRSASW